MDNSEQWPEWAQRDRKAAERLGWTEFELRQSPQLVFPGQFDTTLWAFPPNEVIGAKRRVPHALAAMRDEYVTKATHSNWRDAILKALQAGTLSTEITFDGRQYSVTLRPRVAGAAPAAPTVLMVGQQAICSQCGRVIEYVGPYWRHFEEPQPKHPAIPVDGSPYA